MHKRTTINNSSRFLSDEQLALMFNIGICSARKLSQDADAIIRIGKSKRNDIEKINAFIEGGDKS